MKRTLSILSAAVFAASMAVPAFAQPISGANVGAGAGEADNAAPAAASSSTTKHHHHHHHHYTHHHHKAKKASSAAAGSDSGMGAMSAPDASGGTGTH